MRLLWYHPGPASVDCEDCKRYVYDLERGVRRTYKSGAKRTERPQLRPKGTPLQCAQCPKESPERARVLVLSPRNRLTLRLYEEVRATSGVCLTDAMKRDRVLMRNLADLSELDRARERRLLAEEISYQTALLKVGHG